MSYVFCVNEDCGEYIRTGVVGEKYIYCQDCYDKQCVIENDSKEPGYVKQLKPCKLCPNEARYGFSVDDISMCCKHKLDGMTDKASRLCKFDGCTTTACYGYNNKTSLYCFTHRKTGMVSRYSHVSFDTRLVPRVSKSSIKCKLCDKIPVFNYKGESTGVYCNDHKLDGMINVMCKKCKFEGCDKRASCNFPNISASVRCATHKKPGMIQKSERNKITG